MIQKADQNPSVIVETVAGTLQVRVAQVNGEDFLVVTSETLPEIPFVRIHSSCVFGEAFDAVDCDCGAQLTAALGHIRREGGILIYAWEEGRGVGIADKIRAISIQQTRGLSTSDAFKDLGHEPDPRTFQGAIATLQQVFPGRHIRLNSSNPRKISALSSAGYTVERLNLEIPMTVEREAYLRQKRDNLGHLHDD